MRPWIVLKFGGTSVATAERWLSISERIAALLPTHRVWVVASALSQVSNRLEEALAGAEAGEPGGSLDWLRSTHEELAKQIGLQTPDFEPVAELIEELGQILEGVRLTGEASPRLRARVMSFGELASTHLGLAALRHHGLAPMRVDARELLQSTVRGSEAEESRFLSAEVEPRADRESCEAAAAGSDLVLTQGFIARTPRGETCLLGRGGSDTSAALFAAMLGSESLEIWTDVHGLFTTDPRQIPTARLIRRITYREAQELAAMGARVLHPRCLGPAAWAGIPVCVRNTADPDTEGTRIGPGVDSKAAVMAVVRRTGVTLLTVSTLEMWGAPGFLARVFKPFADLGISVDLVATSQSAVSVTLDDIPGGVDGESFGALLERLGALGEVEVVHPSAVVSIVGRRIRTVLHELGPAFSAFREHEVHLVSESSEDLNLSFLVGEDKAPRLLADLHARLLPQQGGDSLFGPSWEVLSSRARGASASRLEAASPEPRWWHRRREQLLQLVADGESRYVYDLDTVAQQARSLRESLTSVGAIYYAVKANTHPRVLETIAAEGLGMECVSAAEVRRVREVLGDAVPVLFTPNFCPVDEYQQAFDLGAEVTIDGPDVLQQAPQLFAGQQLGLRIDPGRGMGHHESVRTAGAHAKFGHPLDSFDQLLEAAAAGGVQVIGLHAHVGSGILDSSAWDRTAEQLAALRSQLPDLRWIDVGGGLGVVERPGQVALDLAALNERLAVVLEALDGVELRMEPGRYLVSEAGVLLAPVTQVRSKGGVRFVGTATGMNSLLRPALYGAWHAIHNLSRLADPAAGYWHVVGPICETGDVLGRNRLLPETHPGDVLLVENCGAYGAVMSSSYNLRSPATEHCLESGP